MKTHEQRMKRVWRLRGRTPAKATLCETFVPMITKSQAGVKYTKYISKLIAA